MINADTIRLDEACHFSPHACSPAHLHLPDGALGSCLGKASLVAWFVARVGSPEAFRVLVYDLFEQCLPFPQRYVSHRRALRSSGRRRKDIGGLPAHCDGSLQKVTQRMRYIKRSMASRLQMSTDPTLRGISATDALLAPRPSASRQCDPVLRLFTREHASPSSAPS